MLSPDQSWRFADDMDVLGHVGGATGMTRAGRFRLWRRCAVDFALGLHAPESRTDSVRSMSATIPQPPYLRMVYLFLLEEPGLLKGDRGRE